MKLNFEMYIKKLHYYQIVSCVKTFKRRFFNFLCELNNLIKINGPRKEACIQFRSCRVGN